MPIHYDPLISKLVAYGYSRRDAILRMRRAVSEYKVLGIKTTLPFFERVLRHPAFVAGDFDTSFVETACSPRPTGSGSGRWRWRWRRPPSRAFRERQQARVAETERPRALGLVGGRAARGPARPAPLEPPGAPAHDLRRHRRRAHDPGRGARQGRTSTRWSSTAGRSTVDVRETGRHFLSLLIDGRSYEVGLEKRPGGYTVVLADDAVAVDLAEAARGAAAPAKKAGGSRPDHGAHAGQARARARGRRARTSRPGRASWSSRP